MIMPLQLSSAFAKGASAHDFDSIALTCSLRVENKQCLA